MSTRLLSKIFGSIQSGSARSKARKSQEVKRKLRMESLESRELMAVVNWVNKGGASDTDSFAAVYGFNAGAARSVVDEAIADWNRIVTAGANINVSIFASSLVGLNQGSTTITSITASKPSTATIFLDNDGGGVGWIFDTTPTNDSEFNNLQTPFAGSAFLFGTDLYTAASREIGRALGYSLTPGLAINSYITTDPLNSAQRIFNNPSGQFHLSQTLTTAGGLGLSSLVTNDLMESNLPQARRKLVTDENVKLLADAYGYTVALASNVNNLYVNSDTAGNVTVIGNPGVFSDTVVFDSTGSNLRFVVNGMTELMPQTFSSGSVSINTGAGNDNVTESLATNATIWMPVTLNAGDGFDLVTYNGGNTTDYDYTFANGSLSRSYRLVGPSPYNNVTYIGNEDVVFIGGTGADLFTIGASAAWSFDFLRVFGGAGDDVINAANAPKSISLYGEDGNDTLTGSAFADILVGAAGNDTLIAGLGRDMLYGGLGSDNFITNNSNDEDFLVFGRTSYDIASRTAAYSSSPFFSLQLEWTNTTRSAAERASNLVGTGPGTNANGFFLNTTPNARSPFATVFNDLVADTATMDASDWFFNT